MSVIVSAVQKKSPADKAGLKAGDTLVSLNSNAIIDVLDYRFYQNEQKITVEFINQKGKLCKKTVKKGENEELGLEFPSYLMDEQKSCKNKCVFCFIDQLPKGMRDSLYFKDDDSRLSFLFGNYITLTNITEHEIERIIKMHISPVNISVHTTNPELRVRMMKNKTAGEVLKIIDRLNNAGIVMNCQLVLCPDLNDGEELKRTLKDLTEKENIHCIAAVPVGLTKYRHNLEKLEPFNKEKAEITLDIIDEFGKKCIAKYGERRVYGADEFYILAEREIPEAEFYGDFLQLENGVGLWSLLFSEVKEAVLDISFSKTEKTVSVATGVAAYPLIKKIAEMIEEKANGLKCNVYEIKNDFFGEKITVTGLVTGKDIIKQLKGKELGEKLLIPSVMLRYENDMFLDNVTVTELEESLNITVQTVNNDGYELVEAVLN